MPGTLYLENSDFQGLRLNPQISKGKPCIVMLQALWCGYCTMAKEEYNKLKNSDVAVFATIQGEEQKEITQKIMQTKQLQGFPAYVAFDSSGNLVGVHEGNRDSNSLLQFASQFK